MKRVFVQKEVIAQTGIETRHGGNANNAVSQLLFHNVRVFSKFAQRETKKSWKSGTKRQKRCHKQCRFLGKILTKDKNNVPFKGENPL